MAVCGSKVDHSRPWQVQPGTACEDAKDAEDAEDADVDADASSNTRELHTSKRTIVPWMVSFISVPLLCFKVL